MVDQVKCEVSASEINSYLEGDCDFEGAHPALENVISLLRETKDGKATVLLTVVNDLEEEEEDEEEEEHVADLDVPALEKEPK